MQKVPFTNQGIKSKVAELYALSQPLLNQQAKDMLDDFNAWVFNNFDLDDSQEEFMEQLDPDYSLYLGSELSSGIRIRLPVVPDIPDKDNFGSKFLKIEKTSEKAYDRGTITPTLGQIFIKVVYYPD